MSRVIVGLVWYLALVIAPAVLVVPAWAQQANLPSAWQAGPGASGDNTYLGVIDSPVNGATAPTNRLMVVSGWFVDTTAQGWAGADQVQIFLGSMATGTSLGTATLGLSRPDLAGKVARSSWSSAGWSAMVDPASLSPGQNTLSVYAHTPDKGVWFTQVSVTVGGAGNANGAAGAVSGSGAFLAGPPPLVTVIEPMDSQKVSDRTPNLRINGTVSDPRGGPRAIDWVELWLDGEQNSANAYFLGVADLASDGSWAIDFAPFNYPAITSNLYVYAHSTLTGKTALKLVHFDIVDRPL